MPPLHMNNFILRHLCKTSSKLCHYCAKNVFSAVTVTFDQNLVISLSLSPSGHLCHILKTFPRGRRTRVQTTSLNEVK